MMDLSLLLVWMAFMAFGLVAPFAWGLGYVWVDVLTPHRISWSLLSSVPIALIMAVGSLLAYLLMDRKAPPRVTLAHALIGVLAVWITLTETWAVFPESAWAKWDPSVKVLLFTFFMPFLFRSRVQIEAYILVFLLAAAGHLLPWGIKTLLTGGGYNQSLGLLGVNASVLAESSTVAAVAIMLVPLVVWARTHSLIVPWPRARTLGAAGLVVLFLVGSVGTFARTGLVGLALLGGVLLMRSRRKVLFIVLAAIVGGILLSVTSDQWVARMDTVQNIEGEGSAYTRILVWQWTLGFVADHPLGGGFNAFLGNTIVMPPGPDGTSAIQHGRAFHNIYFAVLGEHGYPGLALYATILALTLLTMQRLARRLRTIPELSWAYDLARAAQLSLLIIMACGNFVDISFIFVIWDVVALSLCLNNHVTQVLKQTAVRASAQTVENSYLIPATGPLRGPAIPQYR